MLHDEKWRKIYIDGIETKYWVSNHGRIYTEYYDKILMPVIDKYGYLINVICLPDGRRKTCKVHRLVADAFLVVRSLDETTVNHKDGDKLNNHVSNLEFCTRDFNVRHYVENKEYFQNNWRDNPKYNTIRNKSDMKKKEIELYKEQQRKLKGTKISYSDETLNKICSLLEKGYKVKEICMLLNVKKSAVHDLKYKKRNKRIWEKYNF